MSVPNILLFQYSIIPIMVKSQQIVGHQIQRDQLLADIEQDNVAHAYLFSGSSNLGKMPIARWFAQKLLLQGVPDEKIKDTQGQIEKLVHPDLMVLDQLWIDGVCDDWDIIARTSNVPQQHRSKKPPAKTDIISIDDVRGLQDSLYETGTGIWRCCIIRSMERMQDTAASAFLKILEEPPKGVVFILTTQELSSLLPTVVSRARVVRFHRLAYPELHPLLEGVSEDDAKFILHLSQGAPGRLVNLRDDPDLLREQRLMHSKAVSFWKSKVLRERLSLLKPLHQRGEESKQFLQHLSLALREQISSDSAANVSALMELSEGLKTNAHRQLLTQRFALRCGI
ncbi:MAG: hypothetical protein K9M03_00025 [Kiritimatiellales bacterium]|nr:hypothetical protein [Kiritimatiellales bacterium]